MAQLPSILALMSPPETKPWDSFDSHSLEKRHCQQAMPIEQHGIRMSDMRTIDNSNIIRAPLSPPASPWLETAQEQSTGQVESPRGASSQTPSLCDPILYSYEPVEQTEHALFPPTPKREVDQLIEKHISHHPTRHTVRAGNTVKRHDWPSREEYMLALACVPVIGQQYNEDPLRYLKRARQETEDSYSFAKRICALPGDNHRRDQGRNMKPAPATPTKPRPSKSSHRQAPSHGDSVKVVRTKNESAPPRTPSIRAPSIKRPEDVHFHLIPDYSPSINTLPPTSKALKIEWNSSNPLDLSADPHRSLLHEAELHLASTLRLSCATYLCSKRRIFQGRVRAYQLGKEFRKTDAQQACQIDVNKASKLWIAYDKVGWFDREHFEPHL